MTGKELIEIIKENGLENHDVKIFVNEGEQEEQNDLNALRINPSKNTVAFGHE